MGSHEQTGLAGCFSVDEYERDLIKKHERTRRDKEDDRTRHIVELRAQTGVVFLTYRAPGESTRSCARVTAGEPLYDFTAEDGVQHTMWRAGRGGHDALVARVRSRSRRSTSPTDTIAPRAPRARGERDARPDRRTTAPPNRFIAVAFPDNQCRSFPTTAPSRIWRAARRRNSSRR